MTLPPVPFAGLPASSRVARALRDLRTLVADSEAAARMVAPADGVRVEVVSEVKPDPRTRGGYKLRRFYWSVQRRDAERGFGALTLQHYAKAPAPTWHVFPHDPDLGLVRLPDDATVLRYVPLRRLTFRCDGPDGEPLIGKVKRPERFAEAYALLGTVADAARQASFGVAAPRGLVPVQGMYFQTALAGRDLASQLEPENAASMLTRAGAIHAELHAWPTAGLPLSHPDAAWQAAQSDAAWVAHAAPDLAAVTAEVVARLEATRPGPAAVTFCHGDLACSQMLVDASRWSMVDFDRCTAGDPYRELALFLASLRHDAPCFDPGLTDARPVPESAEVSYLDAYAAAAGATIDEPRLAWHRACAELHYLSLRLRKDRAPTSALGDGVARLEALLAGGLPRARRRRRRRA